MKKYLNVILLFFCSACIAQTPKERIKALKTSFITQELDLTSKEAAVFWPIYFAYDESLETNRRKQARKILEDFNHIETMEDKQVKYLIQEYLGTERALYEAQVSLIENLEGIISNVRIAKLLKAEREFNKRMLQRFKLEIRNNE